MVIIYSIQCGVVPDKGTTGTVSVVRQLQQKNIAANQRLYIAFFYRKKTFDHVERPVVSIEMLWCLEWAVNVIHGSYFNSLSRVPVNDR